MGEELAQEEKVIGDIKSQVASYNKAHEDLSAKASDVNRQLALAGIGIIWLFKQTNSNLSIIIPSGLVLPSILLMSSLFFDLLHYFIGSIIYWNIFREKERELKENKIKTIDDAQISVYYPRLLWGFFYLKIALMIIAYCMILGFLFSKF